MKKIKAVFEIDPLFNQKIGLLICSKTQLLWFLKQICEEVSYDLSDAGGAFLSRTPKVKRHFSIIWLKRGDGTRETLSHEIMHMLIENFSNYTIPMNKENTELIAYYHDSLMRLLSKHL